MGIFTKPTLDRQITDAITSHDRLIARLSDAEVAIIACQTAAEQLALTGADDDRLTNAENQLRAAQDRRSTLKAALAKSGAEVARLEKARDAALDAKQREETASKLELLAREVIESTEAVGAAVTRLHQCAVAAGVIVPEANGLAAFAHMAKGEIPQSGTMIAQLVRQHREMILRGEGSATLAAPPTAPFAEVIPPPEPSSGCVLLAQR